MDEFSRGETAESSEYLPVLRPTCPFTQKQAVMNSSKCPFSKSSMKAPMGGCPIMGPKHTSVKSLCDYLQNNLQFESTKDPTNVITTAEQMQQFIEESRNPYILADQEAESPESYVPETKESADTSENATFNRSTCPFLQKQAEGSSSKCPFSNSSMNAPMSGCPVMGPKHTSVKSLCDYLQSVLEFPKDRSNVITTAEQLQQFIEESRNLNILDDAEAESPESSVPETEASTNTSENTTVSRSTCPFLQKQVVGDSSKCPFSNSSKPASLGGCPVMGPKHTTKASLCDYLQNVSEVPKDQSNVITTAEQLQQFIEESRNHNIPTEREAESLENNAPENQEVAFASEYATISKSSCPFLQKQAVVSSSKCPFSNTSRNAPIGGCPVMGPKRTSKESLCDHIQNVSESPKDQSEAINTAEQPQKFIEESRKNSISTEQEAESLENNVPKNHDAAFASEDVTIGRSTCPFLQKQEVDNNSSMNPPIGGCPVMGPKHTSVKSLCDYLQSVLEFPKDPSNTISTTENLQRFIEESRNYNTPTDQGAESPESSVPKTQEVAFTSDNVTVSGSTCPFLPKQAVGNSSRCPFSNTSTNVSMGGCPVMGPKHTSVKSLCDYLQTVLEFEPAKDASNGFSSAEQLQQLVGKKT